MSFQTPILTEPIIRTPFTDMGAAMLTQQHTVCKDFEMKYIKCLEAYGKSLGETKCQAFLEDFTECSTRAKQGMRSFLIHNEKKQVAKTEGKVFSESTGVSY